MILDKILFDKISPVGKSILAKAKLEKAPQNINEMELFLKEVNESIKKKDFDGLLIGNIFFSFVSSLEVRDRKTTARTFEDIFGALFSISATDTTTRQNPIPPQEILNLDVYNNNLDDWKISSDLATNKREKADVTLGNYSISLKTLRGYAYDENGNKMGATIPNGEGEMVKNNENGELNVGSLSFRALLKGILTDDDLSKLKDRKGGLGSGGALRTNVFDKIISYEKKQDFKTRLSLFMNYVYDDDLYIVLKSNYKITWILIPAQSFINTIVQTYEKDEPNFQKIWYRWENNNLRMDWNPILEKLDLYKLSYYKIEMDLGDAVLSEKMEEFRNQLSEQIEKAIQTLL